MHAKAVPSTTSLDTHLRGHDGFRGYDGDGAQPTERRVCPATLSLSRSDYSAIVLGKANGRHPGLVAPPNSAPRRACQQKKNSSHISRTF